MSFPKPKIAQVICYSYLWNKDYIQGKEEGTKDRPCAVILVTKTDENDEIVTVLPITHTPPSASKILNYIEIPTETKNRLGLDDERSWIVLTEANRFIWPGPDVRLRRKNDPSSILYGSLPENFFNKVRSAFITLYKTGQAWVVKRTE